MIKDVFKRAKPWCIPVGLTLFFYVVLRFVIFVGYVPTESMEPTLPRGSVIIGTRIFNAPQVGDIIVFAYAAQWLSGVISGLRALIEETGVDIKYFTSVIKVVGIAYITQFGAEILRDSGENAIALKLELAGKIFIMSLTLPIISDFLHACIEAVKMI